MIQCKHCNAALPNKAKYCTDCGTQVPDNIKFCPECHSDIPNNAKFCVDCGTVVEQNSAKSISAILVFLIIAGAGLVVYRSIDKKTDTNYYSNNQSIEKSNVPYNEISFHTLIFRGLKRHEIRLDVYTPTTQALIVKNIIDWIDKSITSASIADSDEVRVNVYEKNNNTNEETLRAKLIRINLEVNSKYSFPEGNYSNIGNNLYINWISKQAN